MDRAGPGGREGSFLPDSSESGEALSKKCGVGKKKSFYHPPKKKHQLDMFVFNQITSTYCRGPEGYIFCHLQLMEGEGESPYLNFEVLGTKNLFLRYGNNLTISPVSECKYFKTRPCLKLNKCVRV